MKEENLILAKTIESTVTILKKALVIAKKPNQNHNIAY